MAGRATVPSRNLSCSAFDRLEIVARRRHCPNCLDGCAVDEVACACDDGCQCLASCWDNVPAECRPSDNVAVANRRPPPDKSIGPSCVFRPTNK